MFLIPTPKEIKLNEESFFLTRDCEIILDSQCDFSDLESARLLQSEVEKSIGFKLAINKLFVKEKYNNIYLRKCNGDSESYTLTIDGNGVEICGGDDAGLFYGVQTLCQILRQRGVSLPALVIKDSPYFKYRGFYHDVTRGKVPTLETLKELVDRASFYKINQIQLYIEHTFAFKHMSEVWVDKDPITAEEILILDEYCRKRHVELVPSLSTFGHLYEVLSTRTYGHLCELDDNIGKPYSWIDRQLHHTLDVSNAESFELIERMLKEFIPLFSSDKFNICCDETFDLGKGKSAKLAEKVGKGRLYTEFLNKIIDCVKKYNKQVMFWADIILRHKELMGEIPSNVICLNWAYHANVKEDDTKTIAETGHKQYVCPGVAGWNRMMNEMDTAFTNITRMCEYGKKYGAVGVLNTDWGDYGHVNFFGNSMPGMIYGALLSWNPDGEKDFDKVDEMISTIEYGKYSKDIISLLRDLSRVQVANWSHIVWWYEVRTVKKNEAENLLKPLYNIGGEELLKAYNKSMEIEMELIKRASEVVKERKLDMEEFIISAKGIALINASMLAIKKYDLGEDVRLILKPEVLAVKLEYWISEYSRLWRARNKESELFRIRNVITYICAFLRENVGRNNRVEQ